MPLRLPASPNRSASPDASRRWLWLVLLTGLLALLLAGSAMAQRGDLEVRANGSVSYLLELAQYQPLAITG